MLDAADWEQQQSQSADPGEPSSRALASKEAERAAIEAELSQQLEVDVHSAKQTEQERAAVVESLMSRLDELAVPGSAVDPALAASPAAVRGNGGHANDSKDVRDVEFVHTGALGTGRLQAVLDAVVEWAANGEEPNQGRNSDDGCVRTGETQTSAAEASMQALAERELGDGHPFMCPISLRLMFDPVITTAGTSYERSSIQRWLDQRSADAVYSDPKTGTKLESTTLTPNQALRAAIEEWKEQKHQELLADQTQQERGKLEDEGKDEEDAALIREQDAEYEAGLARDLMLAAAVKREEEATAAASATGAESETG